MPGQRQKGKKNIRKSRVRYELVEPLEDQLIAEVEATHGGYPPRFSCKTMSGDIIIAPIQGSIAKGPRRVLVRKGDLVLLDPLKDYTTKDGKMSYYIHHVYTAGDKRELEKSGHLKAKVKTAEETKESKVVFGDAMVEDFKEMDDEIDIDDI